MTAPIGSRIAVACRLRRNAIDAERLLWHAPRDGARPRKFRRQRPIGRRIADFARPGRKPAIELEGGRHEEAAEAEAARSAELASHGYRVVRFRNDNVLANIEGVLETIRRACGDPPPHPAPFRPAGRRGS